MCGGSQLPVEDQRLFTNPHPPPPSSPGPYPFPLNAKIEGAWLRCKPDDCDGDRHVLVRDNNTCELGPVIQRKLGCALG